MPLPFKWAPAGFLRRPPEAGDVDFDQVAALADHRRLQEVHPADEFGHRPGARMLVDLLRAVALDDAPPEHHRDAIRHGERLLLVRSEEHTSELQSLMRISYAVFCLKKKNTNIHIQ